MHPMETLGRAIKVKAVPRSKKRGLLGIEGDIIKIGLKSPPEEGKANEELIAFLSEYLRVKRSDIKIIKGMASRNKTVFIKGQIEKCRA